MVALGLPVVTGALSSPTPDPAPAPVPEAAVPQPGDGWRLAWAEEFDGTSLDRGRWNVENHSTYGDGNQELACLMDRPENLTVSGGTLTITARRETTPVACGTHDTRFPGGRSYTSAHLTTKDKAAFTYGRVEMRAQLPTGAGTSKGLWPAFWMRPSSGGAGEIDIMEAIGSGAGETDHTTVHQSLHYDYVGTHPRQSHTHTFGSGGPSDGMHTYAVEWEPDEIRWYVDDQLTYTRTGTDTPWLSQAFDQEFFLRLNMAVGGTWPGSPDAATRFPAAFRVDHIRVYQR